MKLLYVLLVSICSAILIDEPFLINGEESILSEQYPITLKFLKYIPESIHTMRLCQQSTLQRDRRRHNPHTWIRILNFDDEDCELIYTCVNNHGIYTEVIYDHHGRPKCPPSYSGLIRLTHDTCINRVIEENREEVVNSYTDQCRDGCECANEIGMNEENIRRIMLELLSSSLLDIRNTVNRSRPNKGKFDDNSHTNSSTCDAIYHEELNTRTNNIITALFSTSNKNKITENNFRNVINLLRSSLSILEHKTEKRSKQAIDSLIEAYNHISHDDAFIDESRFIWTVETPFIKTNEAEEAKVFQGIDADLYKCNIVAYPLGGWRDFASKINITTSGNRTEQEYLDYINSCPGILSSAEWIGDELIQQTTVTCEVDFVVGDVLIYTNDPIFADYSTFNVSEIPVFIEGNDGVYEMIRFSSILNEQIIPITDRLALSSCIKQPLSCHDFGIDGSICYDNIISGVKISRSLTSDKDICVRQLVSVPTDIRINILLPCEETLLIGDVDNPLYSKVLTPERFIVSDEEWCCFDLIPFTNNLSACEVGETGEITNENTQNKLISRRYLKPIEIYCHEDGMYRSLASSRPVSCSSTEYEMPGIGAKISEGIIGDDGYYPSLCLKWNVVRGKVGLYRISTPETKIIPAKIQELSGKLIAFSLNSDYIIDEMSRLNGEGNSGHDCISYEMDKTLHDPDNCLPIEFDKHRQIDYFSGVVRSSGLSGYFDYFDIIPSSINKDDIDLVLQLKTGIDYDIIISMNRTMCPSIDKVVFDEYDGGCYITFSGLFPGYTYMLGDNLLKTTNHEITTIKINPEQRERLYIVNGVDCAELICMSNLGQLITYPSNNIQISRPNGPEKRKLNEIRDEIMKQQALTSWQVVLIIIVTVVVFILSVAVVFLGITRVEYTYED